MPDVKLILTDLDGTLVEPGGLSVSPKVRAAVKAAAAKGVKVCAVTGRPYDMAQPVLQVLGISDPCIIDGGATIVKPESGEIVWSLWLEAAQVRDIVRILKPHARLISLGDLNHLWRPGMPGPRIGTGALSHVWANVAQERAEEIVAQLAAIPGVIAHANPEPDSEPNRAGVHATHYRADKSFGVEQLLTMLNIDKTEVMAVGDGDNDIPLFVHAALKVAVGNATDRLKALANHIAPPVSNDGFAEAVQRYVLKTLN